MAAPPTMHQRSRPRQCCTGSRTPINTRSRGVNTACSDVGPHIDFPGECTCAGCARRRGLGAACWAWSAEKSGSHGDQGEPRRSDLRQHMRRRSVRGGLLLGLQRRLGDTHNAHMITRRRILLRPIHMAKVSWRTCGYPNMWRGCPRPPDHTQGPSAP